MKVLLLDSKVEKFIRELDDITYAKVIRMTELLEQYENHLGLPHSKKLMKDIFELRIQGNPAVRLLYAFRDTGAIILHGFIKKTQKTPGKELEIAIRKLKSLQHR